MAGYKGAVAHQKLRGNHQAGCKHRAAGIVIVSSFDRKLNLQACAMRAIYKICHAAEWAKARGAGTFAGSDTDRRDGSSTFPPETKRPKQPPGISPVSMTSCL